MKKLVTFALAAVLTMSMGMTAFAATSITTDVETDKNVVAVDQSGKEVAVEGLSVNVEKLAGKEEAAKAAMKEKNIDGTITDIVEVTTNEVGQSHFQAGGSLKVTFLVPGAKSGDTYKVLHQKADSTWEVLAASVGDGTVTATFTSLSPVVIVKVASADKAPNQTPDKTPTPGASTDSATNQTSAAKTTASPKTSDFGTSGIVTIMAVCAAALVVVNRRKTA